MVQDSWLVAPEKENAKAHVALSALARALHRKQKACIVRFVPRANQAVFVGCATPLLGGTTRPDCLVLNYLPFLGKLALSRDQQSWPNMSVRQYHTEQPTVLHLLSPSLIDLLKLLIPSKHSSLLSA